MFNHLTRNADIMNKLDPIYSLFSEYYAGIYCTVKDCTALYEALSNATGKTDIDKHSKYTKQDGAKKYLHKKGAFGFFYHIQTLHYPSNTQHLAGSRRKTSKCIKMVSIRRKNF